MPLANWFLALVVPEQAGLTQLLRDARDGDSSAGSRAYGLIYELLHDAARRQLRRAAGPQATLTPTALVNEAWLKLAAARRRYP